MQTVNNENSRRFIKVTKKYGNRKQTVYDITVPGFNYYIANGILSHNTKNYSVQTVPRDQRMRAMFIAEPEHKILGADYSQMELRMMAWYAQDATMLQEFADKVDIHVRTATQIFYKPADQI